MLELKFLPIGRKYEYRLVLPESNEILIKSMDYDFKLVVVAVVHLSSIWQRASTLDSILKKNWPFIIQFSFYNKHCGWSKEKIARNRRQ
jgi:hypothetical protein